MDNIKLSKEISKSLDIMGYNKLTQVQALTIPEILKGKDLIVKSETGSGKTAAFAIPLSDQLVWDEISPQVLVLVPTRELAVQVKEEFFKISRFKRLKVLEIFGKSPYNSQTRSLKQRTHVVVGTPGRVLDHILRGNLKTSKLKYLVLDEADEMLNMGFQEELEKIITRLPQARQSLMFSATISNDILAISQNYMLDPDFIEVVSQDDNMDRIEQIKYRLGQEKKLDFLYKLILAENPDRAVIFCNTRDQVDLVSSFLESKSASVEKIHGGMEQDDRTQVMQDFKSGSFRYLVATDVAARGIDVDKLDLVLNYDLPNELESYLHRIGRTGRKGNFGRAISLYREKEADYIKEIEAFTSKEMTPREADDLILPDLALENFKAKMARLEEIVDQEQVDLNKNILKLHINAGKKTKMRAGDIVGAISNIEGVSSQDIGIIDIIDVSSFVEILNNKGELVLEALQTKEIKGRLRTVSKARR